jgi:N-acetylglutamate synthase-like GNAT family acetyltransferase
MIDVSTDKSKRMKRKQFPNNLKIASREIITDQSDLRMIDYRRKRGEFEPGYHAGNTVTLEITEYEAGPDEIELKEVVRFHDGEPSPLFKALMREIVEKVILKAAEEKERESWSRKLNIGIRAYRRKDRKAVLELWKTCQLTQPLEEPAKDINRRIEVNPDLFLVGVIDDEIIAAVMGRCDENRSWIEYLAVSPSFRRKGIGRQLIKIIEEKLCEKGCSEAASLTKRSSKFFL